jgi:hypothetical protein
MQMRCRNDTLRERRARHQILAALAFGSAPGTYFGAKVPGCRSPDRKRNNKALMQGLHGSLRKTHFGDMMLVLV